jgi:8-oxo-dGTP pyrophosphatase MutT (NUDIX family)
VVAVTGVPSSHGGPRSSAHDTVEVVDPDGSPVGLTTRAEMRAHNARHRATYVVVRDRDGRVVVHQRAGWKDIWPSRWDVAFGGVCEPGEAWRDGAVRELAEEAGITVDPDALVDLGPVRFESAETRVIGRVYVVEHDGPFTFPDGEVVAHDRIAGPDMAGWAARTPLCADSAAVVVPLLLGR